MAVAVAQARASPVSVGMVAGLMAVLEERFSSTIHTTLWYLAGPALRVPQGPAVDAGAAIDTDRTGARAPATLGETPDSRAHAITDITAAARARARPLDA